MREGAEQKRRGGVLRRPLTTTSHCAYCPQTIDWHPNNTTKVHVSLTIVNTRRRHLSLLGIFFFVYFRTNYVAIRCWKISHISALWVLTKAKCHYTWFLWWQSVLKMCLEMCWWHVDFCCILASYSASTNTSSVITKTSNPALIQYKDVHSVCGF